MLAPRVRFLESSEPLAVQVAGCILEGQDRGLFDFRDTQVWVPTAGASRRIRHALAALASKSQRGVLSPAFLQPMQALLPANPERPLASREERAAAWGLAISKASQNEIVSLFPRLEALQGAGQLMGAGSLLADLCDLLAESGYQPGDSDIFKICDEDEDRWMQIQALYRGYLEELEDAGLRDANLLRIAQTKPPGHLDGIRRVLIACIPDLPVIAETHARRLLENGVSIEVLVWKPGEMAGGFDAWGRPLTSDWGMARSSIALSQILRCKDPDEETDRVLDFFSKSEKPGDYALVLADPDRSTAFESGIERRGGTPFVPDGGTLAATSPGRGALLWQEWMDSQSLKILRNLLEEPKVSEWLGQACGLSITDTLLACDVMTSELLAESLEQAESALKETPDALHASQAAARRLAERLVSALRKKISMEDFLTGVWSGGGAKDVLEVWSALQASPIFDKWPEARDVAFARALTSAKTFSVSGPGELEIHGWLEAPWLEAGRLAVSGCVEGRLPASINEHAFLPDSKRSALGIMDNASRYARDHYLLTCLVASRPRENLLCSFSKYGPDESPCLPSRLLLQCDKEELPDRVLTLFSPASESNTRPLRQFAWKWHLAGQFRKSRIHKVSPTDFSKYLLCPLRFYFERILGAEAFDPRAREMDALRFGTLIHKALENFGIQTPGESSAAKIEAAVISHLEAEAITHFGPDPSPAARVQLESAKVRLKAFARIQAEEFAAGWRIVDVERKLSWDEESPLLIGPLPLSGKIDRIERHPEFGIRILDYKTFASAKTPEKSHFASVGDHEAIAEFPVVNGKQKRWTDLQLPLYKKIAARWYPDQPVQAAYFLLPADPSGSGLATLPLPDDIQDSAMLWAETIAERISRGVFWPPGDFPASWDDPFAPLFMKSVPEDNFDEETIAFLKGRP